MDSLEFKKISCFKDPRGVLGVLEMKDYVDWPVKRVYYVTDVTADRGGHAVRHEKKIYICLKGSILARFHDGHGWSEHQMRGPDDAIVLSKMLYREFVNFSKDAVLLAISSVNYNPDDYIYDLEEYINEVNK
ncbi:hypothetical protein GF354_04965 [Candidatus Peregrinibacteria bacterium]|nr:hypothetical protein [Candidatus Peregrinibacteria bacterium]